MASPSDGGTEVEEQLAARFAATPLYGLVGMTLGAAAGGRARLEIVAGAQHCNLDGVVHGGVYSLLLDTALGFAARTVQPPDTANATLDLSVSFVAPGAVGDRLVAHGAVADSSGRFFWAEGEVVTLDATGAGRTLARGRSLSYARRAGPPDHQRA